MIDIDLNAYGEVLPPKNNKIALIDADTLAYTACLANEEIIVVTDEDISKVEHYDAATNTYKQLNKEGALAKAHKAIESILEATGCEIAELHFTKGRANFRYQVATDYKANRVGTQPPAGLNFMKEELSAAYANSTIHYAWEADDWVVWAKTKYPDDYILVAIDKDVLNAVPGKHYNYYANSRYDKKPKWVTVTEAEARLWPYIQCITGDRTDNIKGVKGLGPKKALKFVSANMTHEQLWNGVVNAWESKGLNSLDAIVSMNLVNMHLLQDDGTIKYWLPDFEGSE